jgi:hypothetical protein
MLSSGDEEMPATIPEKKTRNHNKEIYLTTCTLYALSIHQQFEIPTDCTNYTLPEAGLIRRVWGIPPVLNTVPADLFRRQIMTKNTITPTAIPTTATSPITHVSVNYKVPSSLGRICTQSLIGAVN